jgi:hypothetical protein
LKLAGPHDWVRVFPVKDPGYKELNGEPYVNVAVVFCFHFLHKGDEGTYLLELMMDPCNPVLLLPFLLFIFFLVRNHDLIYILNCDFS